MMNFGFVFYLEKKEKETVQKTLEDFRKESSEFYDLYSDGLKTTREEYIDYKSKENYHWYLESLKCTHSVQKIFLDGMEEENNRKLLTEIAARPNFIGFIDKSDIKVDVDDMIKRINKED